jgi:hypothetical protein
MPKASRSITIDRQVGQVFALVADGGQATRWRPGVLDIRRVSGTGVGARHAQGVRGPMGRHVAVRALDDLTRLLEG